MPIKTTNNIDHRLIFCINSGRSGSQYLAELLGTGKEVTSFHEAEPTMSGDHVRLVNKYPYSKTANKRRIKSYSIKKKLEEFRNGQIYCETNHMFIKTFFDVVLEDFIHVDVIILRRQLTLVLKSFIELGYFSPKNNAWSSWMTSPNAKTAALQCIGPDKGLDQYDLCIAYLFDIEARALRFQAKYPGIRTHQIRLENLNERSHVESLFRDLGIKMTDKTENMLGKKSNSRDAKKTYYNNPCDLAYARARIENYIEKAHAQGIALPPTLTLD
jgi:hypothetical protein